MLTQPNAPIRRVALVSVHGCPLAHPGTRSAGGMNVYLKVLVPLLAQSGICVDVFTRAHDIEDSAVVSLGPRARVVHLPAGPLGLSKEEVFDVLPRFLEQVSSFAANEGLGYDLVHSHYWLSGWVGHRLAESWGVPHVVTFHTLALVKQSASGSAEHPERDRVEQELSRGADAIVVFTPGEQEALVGLYGASPSRIHIAPGGVDLDQFRPLDKVAARQRLGFNPDDQIVLYVGRLDPFKGTEVLLHAFREMALPNKRLAIVGGEGQNDPEAARLWRLAEELGIASSVHWQRAIPHDQLGDYYNAADVYAMPSYHESFGLAALEAMACGTPVVAARVGALSFLALDRRTGRLVDDHSPATFARSLEATLSDTELLRRLGQGATEWAQQFPWSRAARAVLDVYGGAVAQAGSGVAAVAPCRD